ncbi:MAG: hypothetical protein U0Q21_15870 [Dermatophilaceae bacterium]
MIAPTSTTALTVPSRIHGVFVVGTDETTTGWTGSANAKGLTRPTKAADVTASFTVRIGTSSLLPTARRAVEGHFYY